MTKKQLIKQKYNQQYYKRVKERGYKNALFLIPESIHDEVKQFIQKRKQEIASCN